MSDITLNEAEACIKRTIEDSEAKAKTIQQVIELLEPGAAIYGRAIGPLDIDSVERYADQEARINLKENGCIQVTGSYFTTEYTHGGFIQKYKDYYFLLSHMTIYRKL